MSIENYVLQASRRSDCILSVLPCFGGCVINPLRSEPVYSDTPQNNSLSWAEQHGLLTNSNIDISDKGFITHDPTISGGIKTTLDFRGNTTSKTFIAKLLCPQHADGKLHVFPIISQGDLNVTREATFQFNVLENSNGLYNPRFFVSNGSIFSGAALASAIDIEKPHVFAAVWEQSPSASTIRCRRYVSSMSGSAGAMSI